MSKPLPSGIFPVAFSAGRQSRGGTEAPFSDGKSGRKDVPASMCALTCLACSSTRACIIYNVNQRFCLCFCNEIGKLSFVGAFFSGNILPVRMILLPLHPLSRLTGIRPGVQGTGGRVLCKNCTGDRKGKYKERIAPRLSVLAAVLPGT